MRKILFIIFTALFSSCVQQVDNTRILQNQIDSLTSKLANSYKPGFGDFMMSIQTHHAKLWFAGQAENWRLADFEIQEIKETLEDIQKYCVERPESKSLPMINPPIEKLIDAIQKKNTEEFKNGFVLLTNTCNNCHKTTGHDFNVITIPIVPPVTNQNFKLPANN
jgi:hypothetical protein